MTELKAGIIGLGKMGMLHAAILNSIDNVKVTAVADTEKLNTNFIGKNIPTITVYNDYNKMLDDAELDLVYITTPVSSHVSIASECAKKNLHFFIEKPLGRTANECKSLCKLTKNFQTVNMVGYVLRYSDTFKKAKELLDEGILGDIKEIKSSIFHTHEGLKGSGWRFKKEISGGGILIDLGAHLIDLLIWYFGKIKTVRGTIESFVAHDIEDNITGFLTFKNNIKCSFAASWTEKNYRLQETSIEIEGTLCRMKVNQDFLKIEYIDKPPKGQNNRIFYKQDLYKGIESDLAGPEFTNADLDFINCIREEKQSQLNVINSSLVHSVIDIIYKSTKTKQSEDVSYIEY